jgi:hypothetical protein
MDIANIPIENNIKKETYMQLLNIIKDEFTTDEQKLFVESFQLYLQYDDENEFIIDLDNIWKWLGFNKKGDCKVLLIKIFEENKDYKIIKNSCKQNFASDSSEAKNIKSRDTRGGHNKENILMTIKCFKKLCLKSNTKKADEIHDYYIKLKKCNQKCLEKSLQKLLQEKDDKIKELEKPIYFEVPKEQWIYVFQEISKKGQNIYKIGLASKSVDKRKQNYKTYASDGFEEIFRFNTNNCFLLENVVKQLLYKYKYRHVSEKGGTEYYESDIEYIKNIIKISGAFIDTLFGTHDNISKTELVKIINNNIIKNLYGSDEYIKTFLPEIIVNNCQKTFNENQKNIKKKFKKYLDKNDRNDIAEKMCENFNEVLKSILPEDLDYYNNDDYDKYVRERRLSI